MRRRGSGGEREGRRRDEWLSEEGKENEKQSDEEGEEGDGDDRYVRKGDVKMEDEIATKNVCLDFRKQAMKDGQS